MEKVISVMSWGVNDENMKDTDLGVDESWTTCEDLIAGATDPNLCDTYVDCNSYYKLL